MLSKEQQRTVLIAFILALGTALLYWPVAGFDFVNLDDPDYVLNNIHIKNGLSWSGLMWCFQAGYAQNWHPLTWFSHMFDCQLFGLRPGPPHLVNVLLHIADSIMLFVAIKRLTGAFWRGAMVAALFAWHPMHVESVAWIAERKDVLSAFFWMLTLWFYARYAEELAVKGPKSKRFYWLALLSFAFGLMAKPMIITLPCVLLLLDWWPLKRNGNFDRQTFFPLLREKAPFFLLSVASGVMTIIAQTRGGAVAALGIVSPAMRVSNVVVAYLRYIEKLLYPADLSVIYPLEFEAHPALVLSAVAFMVGASLLVFDLRTKRPYLMFGWFWFLGTLIPVIGIIQVGGQSMADRYTYIPSIGIFIVVCWLAVDVSRNLRGHAAFLAILGATTVIACAATTQRQIKYWQNSGTLFQHALAIDPNNYIAHGCYGCYLRDNGQLDQAQGEFQRAIEISPIYMVGYTFLSGVLEAKGKNDEAMRVLQDALKVRPDFSDARCEIAKLLFAQGRYPDAQRELEDGLKLDSDDAGLHLYLGYALSGQRNYVEAEEQFALAASLAPEDVASHYQWALALAAQHEYQRAIAQYRATLKLDPDFANALNNLAWILAANPDAQQRNPVEAIQLASRACALTRTNDPIKIETLANSYAAEGRFEEAVAWSQTAREVALAHGQTNIAEQNLELQKLFKAHRAYFDY
ncbi:MAG TPA: tetratricopeptide repeat protein [Verrucomicrobiae bacterium]